MPITRNRRRGAALLARGVGVGIGVVADRIIGDPQRNHPVALFGSAADVLETRIWADSVPRGALYTLCCLAPLATLGAGLERATDGRPVLKALTTAATTWAVVGAASLAREGDTMAESLSSGDLDGARDQLSHLCGRDPESLDEPELARATVESMAENTADAAVASIFWGAVAGIPGMLVHRGANTLDAMVGHHNERFEHFGKASAHLDDLLDLLPARITGTLAGLLAPIVGGDRRRALSVMARDHAHHPSPNGGWCESAWAGALGVTLGGRNLYYGNRYEDRPLLGDGPRPDASKVHDAATLVLAVSAAAGVLGAGALATAGHLRFYGGIIPRRRKGDS
ncbi:cobalamin biosynthesis protein [Acidipropionibacterium acidipropionici]|uniref:cobalamin biosynthesis protein n=1 Tax=Acidipropionibacterium acidipropionici TaxID=1748 RepID=UPI000413EDD0|nr:cobalamin biosynthesis protein [Acidipropionibacterium acidipropionici]ALN13973.1 cobalamin biosynthesis protein [Acidipropionibacterium acidipropionici]APZ10260.1 adenosylcobinamide-phosphate synthase [Acidipropionibacterium acidipropionici]